MGTTNSMIAKSIRVCFSSFMSADTPMLHIVVIRSPYGEYGCQRNEKYLFWYKTSSYSSSERSCLMSVK